MSVPIVRVFITQTKGSLISGYSKFPKHIEIEIKALSSETFYIGSSRIYDTQDFPASKFARLGVIIEDDSVHTPAATVPPPLARWSKWNANGRVITHKDEQKISRSVGGWMVPNYGDWNRGSHVYSGTREVYRRSVIHGKGLSISMERTAPEPGKTRIAFRVDRLFDTSVTDPDDLLMACSLIRECTGLEAQVVPGDVTMAEWLTAQDIKWEILPEGTVLSEDVGHFARLSASPDQRKRALAYIQRSDFIRTLNHQRIAIGTGGFGRYVAYIFRDDLVILECLTYGNAMYMMYDDWATLSRRSRLSLLADPSAQYDRIVHAGKWKDAVRNALRLHMHELPRDVS